MLVTDREMYPVTFRSAEWTVWCLGLLINEIANQNRD